MSVNDLSNNQFKELVQAETRRNPRLPDRERERLEAAYEELQHPEVVLRWMTVLDMLKRAAERQLGQRKAQLTEVRLTTPNAAEYEKERLKYLRWRISTLRFLTGLEDRLALCRSIRRQQFPQLYPELLVEERNDISEQLLYVMGAVEDHRDATRKANLEPSEADIELWSVLAQPHDPEERNE